MSLLTRAWKICDLTISVTPPRPLSGKQFVLLQYVSEEIEVPLAHVGALIEALQELRDAN